MKKSIIILSFLAVLSCESSKIDDSSKVEPMQNIQIGSAEYLSDTLWIENHVYMDGYNVFLEGYDPRSTKIKDGEEILSKENLLIVISTISHNESKLSRSESIVSYEKIRAKAQHIYDKYEYPKSQYNFYYCHAGLKAGTRIYADKVLFGREPGSNLSDKFKLFKYPMGYYHILSYPDWELIYDYNDKKPELFSEFAVEGVLMVNAGFSFAQLCFSEIPQEDFDEIKFTVEIPITTEYFADYPDEGYEGENLSHQEDRILKGEVEVKLGQKTNYLLWNI